MENYARNFFNSFYANHVILFVGKSATPEEIRTISDCKWSAVITTRTEPEFSLFFERGNRTVQDFTNRANISSKPLSRDNLPVIRLFGIDGEKNDDINDIWDLIHADIDRIFANIPSPDGDF